MYLFGCHEEDSTEKMPYNPILHYPYSSWIKKPMAKTTEYLCDLSFVKQLARGCAEILPKTLKQFSIMLKPNNTHLFVDPMYCSKMGQIHRVKCINKIG